MTDISIQLARIEAKLDVLLSRAYQNAVDPIDTSPETLFRNMTARQHVAMQAIIHGMSNAQIASMLGCTDNTAKVHVRLLARKAGGRSRSDIVARTVSAYRRSDPVEYERLYHLPKDWVLAPSNPELYGLRTDDSEEEDN